MDKKTIEIAFAASGRSYHNEKLLSTAEKCGCYSCGCIYSPSEIKRWTDAPPRTAICPYCGIDSVLDDKASEPFTEQGLRVLSAIMF